MKIAIIGGGAMGGLWASKLTDGGHEVAVIDLDDDVVGRVRSIGLTVESPDGGSSVSRPTATTDAGELGTQDAIYFFVKSAHTDAAALGAGRLVGDSTHLITLQNGWGNAQVLAGYFRPAQIVTGVTYNSATVIGPGHIAHTGAGQSIVGSLEDASGASTVIAELQSAAGLPSVVAADIRAEIWKKLILNAVTLPTSALTRLTAGALGEAPMMDDILAELCEESVAVANAMGLAIDTDERMATIRGVLARAGPGKASMLQDVEGSRKTEIEVINGAVAREADRLGVPAPLNRTMTSLVQALESGYL